MARGPGCRVRETKSLAEEISENGGYERQSYCKVAYHPTFRNIDAVETEQVGRDGKGKERSWDRQLPRRRINSKIAKIGEGISGRLRSRRTWPREGREGPRGKGNGVFLTQKKTESRKNFSIANLFIGRITKRNFGGLFVGPASLLRAFR